MNAIDVANVPKVYRRYGGRKQFATLKSALLRAKILRDLRPDETFPAAERRLVHRGASGRPTASSAGTGRARARC